MFTKLILLFFATYIHRSGALGIKDNESSEFQSVHVGVVLNLNSSVGSVADTCLSMAIKDFYDLNYDYKTRIVLHKRYSEGVATMALSVVDLLERSKVVAIIGSRSLTEAAILIDIGRTYRVPVITFSVPSISISPSKSPYFIRAAQNDSYQVHALTELILGFNWHEIVLIYEDSISGNEIIPYLTNELLASNIMITYKCAFVKEASDLQISEALNKMTALRAQVFLVHMMSTSLASRFFDSANGAGLMSKGYAWIITDGLSNSLDELVPFEPFGSTKSMQGVLGIRPYTPYIPESIQLANFINGWRDQYRSTKSDMFLSDPNIFGLWAYDTIWALAHAVEDSWSLHCPMYTNTPSDNSQEGSKLLNNILNSKPVHGLSGEFHIVNGHLEPLPLEVFNVLGNGVKVVGFWTPDHGFSKSLPSTKIPSSSSSVDNFKIIIWPGDSLEKPLGSCITRKLKIGVPLKVGFPGLVQPELNQTTNVTMYKGYCIDAFRAVVDALPDSIKFEYELIYYSLNSPSCINNTYDELLYQVFNQTIDAAVGDITILADRWYVDFTLPYSDSGIAMVVPRATMHGTSGYIVYVLKAFVAAVFSTLLFLNIFHWIRNENAQSANLWHHWRIQLTSIFGNGEKKLDFRTRLLLFGLFVSMFVILSCNTGSFSSFILSEIDGKLDLNSKDVYIGYQSGSIFVKNLLSMKLKTEESRMKSYMTMEQYDMALSKGSARGGVSVIIDEIPYLKLFLAKYGSKYKFDGRTFRTHGFAFAFPMGSPLVSHMSKAILDIMKSGKIEEIEHNSFGSEIP